MEDETPIDQEIIDLKGVRNPIDEYGLDTIHDLLSHHYRRTILDLLLTHDRALTIRDLRNQIVEREWGTEITEIPQEQVKQAHIALYHTHIPKLADNGIVNYDPDSERVEPTEKLSRLEPFLSQW